MTNRYKPNRKGLQELLRGEAAQALVHEHGDRLASSAGDGFIASYRQGKSRYRGIVYPETWSAKTRNRKFNTLLRTLG